MENEGTLDCTKAKLSLLKAGLILVFSDAVMGRILKRTGKNHFFQFGIDPVSPRSIPKVIGTRGGVRGRDLTAYMLCNREDWLSQQFKRQR